MKKLLCLFLLVFILASSIAFSQNTAVLHLRGMISPNVNVTTNIPETSFIDLRTVRSYLLGSISLNTNQAGGYRITITSNNLGVMKNSSSESAVLSYTLSFGGTTDIDLSTEYQALFTSTQGNNNTEFPVYVNFPETEDQGEQLASGIYEDIIIITISVL